MKQADNMKAIFGQIQDRRSHVNVGFPQLATFKINKFEHFSHKDQKSAKICTLNGVLCGQ